MFADFEDRMAADFPAKARVVAHHLGWRPGNLGGPPRILDVGCGKGFFVRELSRFGFQVEGIDLSATAIKAGTEKWGISGLRVGRLEFQEDWADRFDAVTAWATIEHTPDPRAFLKSISRCLKPGGYLFLDTGLAGDFIDRYAPGLIQWYDAPQHLFVFSRSGLEILLKESGFSIISCDTSFERTKTRRILKFLRNRLLAIASSFLFLFSLGPKAYGRMRMEAKLPFGSLIFIVARLGPGS